MKDTLNPKWQKRRLNILQKDNFTCQICGDTEKTLHVHHTYYDTKKKYWEYEDRNLITLCEDCHTYEHSLSGDCSDFSQSLSKYGITNTEVHAFLECAYVAITSGRDLMPAVTGGTLHIGQEHINFNADNDSWRDLFVFSAAKTLHQRRNQNEEKNQ